MPQCNQKNKKAASGMGNIRKVSKVKNGKEYTYYEARYTEGYDPGTGKQIQRSISGKTPMAYCTRRYNRLYPMGISA